MRMHGKEVGKIIKKKKKKNLADTEQTDRYEHTDRYEQTERGWRRKRPLQTCAGLTSVPLTHIHPSPRVACV